MATKRLIRTTVVLGEPGADTGPAIVADQGDPLVAQVVHQRGETLPMVRLS